GAKLAHINFALGVGMEVARRTRTTSPWDIVSVAGSDGFAAGIWRHFLRPSRRPLIVGITHGLEHPLWQEFLMEERLSHAHISPQHMVWFGGVRLRLVELAIRTCDHMVCRANADREYIIAHGWKAPANVTHI